MNNVILIGNMTRDPELRYTQAGKAVANFTLAVNRPWDTTETDFIRCTCWTKVAENTAQYCSKGSKVAINGRLQVRNYEDKEGVKKTIAEVVADRVQFLDSKKAKGDDYSDMGQEVSEDDVPF